MAGKALTTASTLTCPHQGQVKVVSSNTRTQARGAYVLRSSDSFTIAGCTFSTPGGPMPCLTVQWIAADTRVTVSSGATLSEGSIGLCLNAMNAPQGAVQVIATQPSVTTA